MIVETQLMDATAAPLSGEERVPLGRADSLERAGYSAQAVTTLDLAGDIDLHLVVDLVKRGCPPETAVWILV